MDIQRLRNLTTDRLHTEMEHFYTDLGALVGSDLVTLRPLTACSIILPQAKMI